MDRFTVVFLFLIIPSMAWGYSPVARTDVVPLQRVEYGTTFNFGVIAFSKPGIDDVSFAIASGTATYTGSSPKTSTAMALNSRTSTWEYYISIPSSDFSSNGTFTVTPTITDNNANTRILSATTLIVEATGAGSHYEAWVDSVSGNDGTGTVGNSGLPYLTISAAVSAAQTSNGGSSDGNIIYLEDGTYSVASISASTSGEWLTITKASAATKTAVIINTGLLSTTYLKYDDITLQSQGNAQYVANSTATNLWTNSIRKIGSGRWVTNSNPVHHSSDTHWSTNDYTYDADYAYRRAALVRGAEISTIGNDVFENTYFVVNVTVDDVDNGTTGWHADAFQTHTTGVPPPNNMIVYNYKATNLHYQGVFIAASSGQATDNALVNVFIEMRNPPAENEVGVQVFGGFSAGQTWDHLIMWNCTFTNGTQTAVAGATNSSFVGNFFRQIFGYDTAIGVTTIATAEPGNTENNEYLYNHVMQVYNLTGGCTPSDFDTYRGWPCPQWYAKLPDSDAGGSATTGEGVLDVDYTNTATFTYPVTGSVLIDAISSPKVPIDLYNVERGATADIGAVEYQAAIPDDTYMYGRAFHGTSSSGVSTR